MQNKELIEILVLGMSDEAAIKLAEQHNTLYRETGADCHKYIMQLLVNAIDCSWGEGSFKLYKNTGKLPSEQ